MITDRDEFELLVSAWLGGRATPDEAARIGTIVETDPVARDHLLVLADLHACLATDGGLWSAQPEPVRPTRVRRRIPSALAFAVGLLFGIVPLALALARSGPAPLVAAGPIPLEDGDFEGGPAPGTAGLPDQPGVWGGDFSALVTGPDQGVHPFRGRRMLRLLRSDFEGEHFTRSATGEVFQVIDLRSWSRPPGPVGIEVSGWVNAIHSAPGEDYRWVAHAFAFESNPSDRHGEVDHSWLYRECQAAAHRRDVRDDGDPSAWQQVSVELLVPPTANYLVISFGVLRVRPVPNADPVHFPGHYLDAVEVTPLPQTPNRRR